MDRWARAKYTPILPAGKNGEWVTGSKAHRELSKNAAKEGMVLLENNGALPLREGTKVALLGKGTFDYVRGGGGSGDVYCAYSKNIYDGIKEVGGHEVFEPLCDFYREYVQKQYKTGYAPGMVIEPEIPEELLKEASSFADTAIVSISRFSGEGWDRSEISFYEDEVNPWIIGQDDAEEQEDTGSFENLCLSMNELSAKVFPKRDFYLSDEEEKMIKTVRENFRTVIVLLNVGGMMDLRFLKEQKADAALLIWAPGMEGGTAAAELLCGIGNPSGKLPDTFADTLEAYPSSERFHENGRYAPYDEDIYMGYRYFETIPGAAEHVVYPFGYGLSYTTFEVVPGELSGDENGIRATCTVRNTGSVAGREAVQLYVRAPQGRLGKPSAVLVAFAKTKELKPGEAENVTLRASWNSMASYDDLGAIAKDSFLLERGKYKFFLGRSVRDLIPYGRTVDVKEDRILETLSDALAPTSLPERRKADGTMESLPVSEPFDSDYSIIGRVKKGEDSGFVPLTRARESFRINKPLRPGIKKPVELGGKYTLEEFLDSLTNEELMTLLGGQLNTGMANTFGMGNLPEAGIPSFMTADGPAGVRLGAYCGVYTTCWPCATLLASTFDEALMDQIGEAAGSELKECNMFMWLAPAVNIHRNPMCGRNFEYFSEDPLLAGKLAAAEVRGIQRNRVAATVKHFACNNKETNRIYSDSRVSKRALREIYLKVFEIVVKEADPWCIMSSYNLINGRRCSESKELLTQILRNEWHFNGLVMTDWWNRGEHYKEVLAGNDVKMPVGFPDRLERAFEVGALTRDDLKRSAERVIRLFLKFE